MNALIVGFDKAPILRHIPRSNFLLIDDGTVGDQVQVRARRFDIAKHSFNPIKDIDYRRAREFITVLDAVFPEGETTLTKKVSNFILLRTLLEGDPRSRRRRTLSDLFPVEPDRKDTGRVDAYQKIQTLLLSPVLERVLNRPTTMSFKGTMVARLDRAELGDFDAFVLGNFLISQYSGTVIVPDFGFYACPFHVKLLRQGRLIAGINSFDEVPDLRNELLQADEKIGSRCTSDDAEVLALYAGHQRGTKGFTTFVEHCIGDPKA
jgi:hypothetical protein